MEKKAKTAVLLILLFLATSVLIALNVRTGYFYPMHSDEYDHIAILKETLKEQKIIHYDPYTVKPYFAPNIEMGFNFFLSTIESLTGIDILLLPAIVSIFLNFAMMLSVFVAVRFFAKSDLAGFLSAIFATFLPNTVALLGNWFMVPANYGLVMIPLILYCFAKNMDSRKFSILFAFFSVQTIIVHPPSLSIFIPVFAAYLLLTPKEIFKHKKELIILIAGLGLTTMFFLELKRKLNIGIENIIPQLLTEISLKMESFEKTIVLQEFLTPIMLALAVIGILFILIPAFSRIFSKIFKKEKTANENENFAKIFPIAIFIMLLIKWNADISRIVYLTIYPRLVTDLSFLILITAGIGFYSLFRIAMKISEKDLLVQKIISASFAVMLLSITAYGLFFISTTFSGGLYKNAELNEVSAISWLEKNSNENKVAIGLPDKLKAVHVLGEKKVVGTSPTRVGNLFSTKIIDFVFAPCQKKEEIIQKNGFAYDIYFDTENVNSDCNYFNKVYSQGKTSVYFKTTTN